MALAIAQTSVFSGTTLIANSFTNSGDASATGVGVRFAWRSDGGAAVSTVTSGADSLTVQKSQGDGGNRTGAIYGKPGPSGLGSQLITITFTLACINGGAACTDTGGDTSTYVGAGTQGAFAGSGTPTLSCTSLAGEVVIDVVFDNNNAPNPTTGANTQDFGGAAAGDTQIYGSRAPGAASVTMAWTDPTARWGQAAISRKAGAGGGGQLIGTPMVGERYSMVGEHGMVG